MSYGLHDKSMGISYLLLFLFGALGAHRLYLGKKLSGFIQLAMTVTGLILLANREGGMLFLVLWLLVGLWLVVDFFRVAIILRRGY